MANPSSPLLIMHNFWANKFGSEWAQKRALFTLLRTRFLVHRAQRVNNITFLFLRGTIQHQNVKITNHVALRLRLHAAKRPVLHQRLRMHQMSIRVRRVERKGIRKSREIQSPNRATRGLRRKLNLERTMPHLGGQFISPIVTWWICSVAIS